MLARDRALDIGATREKIHDGSLVDWFGATFGGSATSGPSPDTAKTNHPAPSFSHQAEVTDLAATTPAFSPRNRRAAGSELVQRACESTTVQIPVARTLW